MHALAGKFRAIELQHQLISFCNFHGRENKTDNVIPDIITVPHIIHCGDFNSCADSDVVLLMSSKITPEISEYLFSNKLKTENDLIRKMFETEIIQDGQQFVLTTGDIIQVTPGFVNCHSAVSNLNENLKAVEVSNINKTQVSTPFEELLDYIFFSDSFKMTGYLSDFEAAKNLSSLSTMPNDGLPSDHIPILVKLEPWPSKICTNPIKDDIFAKLDGFKILGDSLIREENDANGRTVLLKAADCKSSYWSRMEGFSQQRRKQMFEVKARQNGNEKLKIVGRAKYNQNEHKDDNFCTETLTLNCANRSTFLSFYDVLNV